jgi:hypothetical protein
MPGGCAPGGFRIERLARGGRQVVLFEVFHLDLVGFAG